MDNLIMAKGVDKRIDESVFRWFGHVERMENDSSSKKVYVERVLEVVLRIDEGGRRKD